MSSGPSDSGGNQAPTADPALESTLDLLARVRAGDSSAVDRLFSRHLRPLKRWASGRLPRWARDLTDTDDLVQDALVRTFKNIGGFDARRAGSLQAYLRQVVINRIRDELRRKARRPDSRPLDDLDVLDAASPLEEAMGREWVARYEEALGALRPEEREALIGRIEMGYTYAELAEVLGKPSDEAARKAAERALVRLAEAMGRARQ